MDQLTLGQAQNLAEMVASDTQCQDGLDVSVLTVEPNAALSTASIVWLAVNGRRFGTGALLNEGAPAFAAAVASSLQSVVLADERIQWPACTRHPGRHVLVSTGHGAGEWRCPELSEEGVAIGHLCDTSELAP